MTDTDNSKLKAISYYQNIYFSSEYIVLNIFLNQLFKNERSIASQQVACNDFPKQPQIITPINQIM